MNQEQFKHLLIEEGFQDLVIVEREADGYLDLHTHPFEAKALILGVLSSYKWMMKLYLLK